MSYNLATAAAATGANKSTILRAIKAGRVSAQRDATGGWAIEPAELHRVFPVLPAAATVESMPPQRDATTDILVAELRQTIVDLRADRDHWRADSDHWRAAFENTQRLLPAPAQPRATIDHADSSLVRVWRWMRKSA